MKKHIAGTLLVLIAVIVLFEYSRIDIQVQDWFFDRNQGRWMLDRNAVWPHLVFYSGIKKLFIAFVLFLIGALVFFKKSRWVQQYRQGLLIVVFSTITIPLVVGALKAVTHVPCPKDLVHYGGRHPHVTVLSRYPADFPLEKNIKCYPAGHASGGFALMSLFFLFRLKRNRILGLAFAITLGWVTGTYKMLIGDHFLSHTLVTMLLSWVIILLVRLIVTKSPDAKNPEK